MAVTQFTDRAADGEWSGGMPAWIDKEFFRGSTTGDRLHPSEARDEQRECQRSRHPRPPHSSI